MRNAWATTVEQLLNSPALPIWLTLLVAMFFACIVAFALIRAERSVANGALALIALLALGIAVTAILGRNGPAGAFEAASGGPLSQIAASVPALSCLDGLAGDGVETPCERSLFVTADVAAAAVSYTAAQISRLAPLDRPTSRTAEQQSLRKTLERDRYGLVAQVLTARERCTESDCEALALFADPSRIKANIKDRVYEATIGRYALAWGGATGPTAASMTGMPAPPGPAAASAPVMSVTGKPIDFPTSAAIPPVNIMATEPPVQAAPPTPKPPAAVNAQAPKTPPPPPAKKHAAAPPKPKAAAAPIPIVPADSEDE